MQSHLAASRQHPIAVILNCMDSRTPPEIIFDQGIGDICATRIAGNIQNDDILGSMEFGTQLVGAKLIAVIGHTESVFRTSASQINAVVGNITVGVKPDDFLVSLVNGLFHQCDFGKEGVLACLYLAIGGMIVYSKSATVVGMIFYYQVE